MTVDFDKSFLKSLQKIKDKTILTKTKELVLLLEDAPELKDVKSIKKLTGFKNYYRIRIGDFRLGFEKINQSKIRLIILAHRKDIYKKFP
jgi:mRNA interferase RelE/StbE